MDCILFSLNSEFSNMMCCLVDRVILGIKCSRAGRGRACIYLDRWVKMAIITMAQLSCKYQLTFSFNVDLHWLKI